MSNLLMTVADFPTLPVHVEHDWLDYIAAFGGAAGALAAAVALVFAALSKRDAERSAAAAEEALRIMREEAAVARAERERRADPVAQLSARPLGASLSSPPSYVILAVGISNEGTRAAERLVLNVLVSDALRIVPCDQSGNNQSSEGNVLTSSERLGDHVGVRYWAEEIDNVGLHMHRLCWVRIDQPAAGIHRIRVRLSHEDIPTGHRDREWNLEVPERDGAIDLKEIITGEPTARESG